ncbi:hypothetical protein [Pararhodonellum marinum]|uniref:hypothetical protein n=1 Tax=Pararhodonellum marinum TaxID=2755358 RepID=UPI00188EE4DD|nr:hypothetical protein [Pararhodonellum marinum]
MKTISKLMIGLMCLFQFNNAFGQKDGVTNDSIFFKGNEKLNLLITTKDYHLLTKDNHLQTVLIDFQSRLREIKANVPEIAYIIEYRYQKQLDILESNNIKSFNLSEEGGLTENFRNQAIITDPIIGLQVTIGFDEMDELLEADLSSIASQIVGELPEKDRYLRYLEYQPDSQSGKAKLTENRPSGYLDMLSLQAGVGANVYRNKFLTDITGEIGLHLNHKGILRNQFYVSNNLMFSFDAENAAIINNFTSIGYRRNLSNERDKPNWLGVEFGTVTKRSGDIFRPNTMRLGVNWQAGKHITVSPQLYFNGFFQQVSPGFRIGIGL